MAKARPMSDRNQGRHELPADRRKIPRCIRLPPDVIAWLDAESARTDKSSAVLIEEAIRVRMSSARLDQQ
jgi:hypothetical protein